MKSNELFEEFKSYCDSYEIVLNNIVVKNEENRFILFKPSAPDYLLYSAQYGIGREQGSVSDIDDLVTIAKEVVGDKIKSSDSSKNNTYYF